MSFVKIVEVGPRDGLQNERRIQSLATRKKFINELARSGLRNIEIGAFVSPRWVPQMDGSLELSRWVTKRQIRGLYSKQIEFGALVPNERGMHAALQAGLRSIAVFGACSETFSKRNINCSIEESFARFQAVVRLAKKNKIRVRGYLSTAFGCPYEGAVDPRVPSLLSARMFAMGVDEVSIGDTIGVATPRDVDAVLRALLRKSPRKKLAMHFHDTRGTALANVARSLDYGIRIFDSSVGGLGGCPYAEGAAGNLATEDLVYLLHRMGFATGAELKKLIKIRQWIEEKIDHDLPSKVSRAGGWPKSV